VSQSLWPRIWRGRTRPGPIRALLDASSPGFDGANTTPSPVTRPILLVGVLGPGAILRHVELGVFGQPQFGDDSVLPVAEVRNPRYG
jgi:hypothetical protein